MTGRGDLDEWDAKLDSVLEPSNQTTGSAAAGMTLKAGECVRSGCSEPPVDGSEFCGGCRSYMLGDLGEDPVTAAAREHAESLANDFLEHDDGVVGCEECGSPECREGAIRSLYELVAASEARSGQRIRAHVQLFLAEFDGPIDFQVFLPPEGTATIHDPGGSTVRDL